MAMPKPVPVTASIVRNEPLPLAIGDTVTFTTVVPRLKGNEYPLVYLEGDRRRRDRLRAARPSRRDVRPRRRLVAVDRRRANPHYREPAVCVAELWSYGGKAEYKLASTDEFPAG